MLDSNDVQKEEQEKMFKQLVKKEMLRKIAARIEVNDGEVLKALRNYIDDEKQPEKPTISRKKQ